MRKKLAAFLLCMCMVLSIVPAAAAADGGWSVESATWQDENSVMLIWDGYDGGASYNIYRSDSADGRYELIGTSSVTSYLDGAAKWPEAMYYTVEPVAADGTALMRSAPIQAGTNERHVSRVSVIMYHNFITEADEAEGVEFEEYSLRPEDFEADLQYLRDNGYTTITSDDVIDYINGVKPLPAKAVIISIDDGTEGVYKNAWPLLREYRAKADFNLIGANVDAAWETVNEGGTRVGQSAPYCVWEELVDMEESGEINLCSHTYGLHVYNNDGRTGANMKDGETPEEYATVIAEDYALSVSCIGGWTGTDPTTMAYPYSRRSDTTDALILANTGYEILMGGEGARGTAANYFVDGADPESQKRIMSRPCRMEGSPISTYLDAIDATDAAAGVNTGEDTLNLSAQRCAEIARWYSPYSDVAGSAWYAGAVYYAYVNGLLLGTSYTQFDPNGSLSRDMAATVLSRLAGENEVNIAGLEGGEAITRAELAGALYELAKELGYDTAARSATGFADMDAVPEKFVDAVLWAEAKGIFEGGEDGRLRPMSELTRAEFATVLMRWCTLYA